MKLSLDPTLPKVVIIAILIALEAALVPTITITQSGRWPSTLEVATFSLTAIVQMITYLLLWLSTGEVPPVPPSP